ncbi:MAG TPA: pantoate--beta-alanine ligase [Syntrophomonadaceae bacterium]|nr:pantoate--beta-alanine ligase [Syntrophomonadaceae bacterium]
MKVFNNVEEIQKWCIRLKEQGKKIGIVPTMGFLHEGHLTLVREAKRLCDIVVVSIFVNPIQFGQGEDFGEYPRDLSQDTALLQNELADAVFAPTVKEMYPNGYSTFLEVNSPITTKLCGNSRPGHFKGVTTVVSKLFNICQPDLAFFGQKDYQQLLVVKKMVRELNFPIEIVGVPIVREYDGLAISSRNVNLTPDQRQAALTISSSLKMAQEFIENGETNTRELKQKIQNLIKSEGQPEIEYIEIVDDQELLDLEKIIGKVLIAVAVKYGNTRLIDNLLVEV